MLDNKKKNFKHDKCVFKCPDNHNTADVQRYTIL